MFKGEMKSIKGQFKKMNDSEHIPNMIIGKCSSFSFGHRYHNSSLHPIPETKIEVRWLVYRLATTRREFFSTLRRVRNRPSIPSLHSS